MYGQGSKNRKPPKETEDDLKSAIHLGGGTTYPRNSRAVVRYFLKSWRAL
jgi:hypothetical protein